MRLKSLLARTQKAVKFELSLAGGRRAVRQNLRAPQQLVGPTETRLKILELFFWWRMKIPEVAGSESEVIGRSGQISG